MTPLRIHLSAFDDARRTAMAAWLPKQSAGYMQVVDSDERDVSVVLGGTEIPHPGSVYWRSAPLVWWPDAGANVANLPPTVTVTVVATDDELLGALWMHEMQRDFCALEVP